MKQLAGKTLGEDFLKTLWLQHLLMQAQAILSVSEDRLEILAIMVDKIHETAGANVDEVLAKNPHFRNLANNVLK